MPIPELRSVVVVGAEDVPHLQTMESRGRTSHVHWDGCEVQRQFYVNQFWAAPHVCAALLGFVLQETTPNDGQVYKRYLPAFDPIYDQIMYCNEARWEHVDKQSISAASPLKATPGDLPIRETYTHFMDQVNTVGENKIKVTENGLLTEGVPGGAFITASYRPLISAYKPKRYDNILTLEDRIKQFDYMDPVIVPGMKTVPWPGGLEIVKRQPITGLVNRDAIDDSAADPLTVPMLSFSVRRMFLGTVPFQRFDKIVGKLNNEWWPQREGGLYPYTFPASFTETLRFDSYEITQHWSQVSNKNVWFEVKFNFTALRHWAWKVFDTTGDDIGPNWVTWNHIFYYPGSGSSVGWYRVEKVTRPSGMGFPLVETADFNELFAAVTPLSQ